MAQYRNVAGVVLDIPGVGVVEDDGVFTVADDLAPGFDCQPSNYDRLDEPVTADEENDE